MRKSVTKLSLAGCALFLHTGAFGQGYHSNDLTPAGSSSGRLSGISGGTQVGAATSPLTSYSHAVLLNGNALTAIDLHPAAYYYSMAMCTDGLQQGGWGYSLTGGGIHALVWNGSSSSYSDLNPSGYMFSYCLGVDHGEQVGYAQNQSYFVTASHAMCWYGSAGSVVDLHPAWLYGLSRAVGCRNGEEVGYVSTLAYPDGDAQGYHTTSHAVRWAGTAASAVDLNPVGYDASEATCTNGTQEGGWGYQILTNTQHAMVWSGDASTAVDLHPVGYTDSKVTSLTATQQVGEGWIGAAGAYTSVRHALLWSGTADSVVDLNQYLPAGYTNAVATGIDANGNVVGYAYNGAHPYGLNIPAGAIAVVFAPGAPIPTQLASITLSASNAIPGDAVPGTVTLGGPAPAGGTTIQFLSTQTTFAPTPASVVVPEGATTAPFTVTTSGTGLTVPTSLKIYASDGSVSYAAPLTLTPVVKLATLDINPVEGGFSTYGTVALNIPAQAGGATVTLTSGASTLVTLPSSLTFPQGYTSMSFLVNTVPVTQSTTVPITATFNGTTVTGNLTLSPAPVVSIAALSGQEVIGGQPMPITVTLNNFPRAAAGATVTLTSSDTRTLQLPATVTIPMGAYSATVMGTTTVVSGIKGVTIKATYNGTTLSANVSVDPIPPVTITQAEYLLDTKMLKVTATTPYTNTVLTYGDTATGPFGTMQFELGAYKGSIILDTPPTSVTVWSSVGGQASMPVTIKTTATGGGGGGGTGGGGGGGGSTSTQYKLTIVTNGKGTVTASPAASTYAPGTVVTLTATPAVGSPWIGWSGAASGTALTTTVTITKDTSVTANFK